MSLIIDHHPENAANILSCEKRIELVGSCSSLVADYAMKAAVNLPDDARELIASTIVIDTSGFSPIQALSVFREKKTEIFFETFLDRN